MLSRLLSITLGALPLPARLLFLAAGLLMFAVSPLSLEAQYHVDAWTTVAGLPQNSVYSIIQTRDGYIWFTTLDGLVQYDGVRFRVFNRENGGGGIRSNRFTSLHQSGDGTLWAGTEDDGLTRYRNGTFRTFTVSDGLPHNGVWAMRDEGSAGLLVSTYAGPAHLRDERFAALVDRGGASHPRCIDLSTAGACWYQDAAGLHRYLDGQTATYTAEIGLPNKTAYRIYEDRDGAAWIAWSIGGVGVIKRDGSFTSYDATAGLPPLAVTAMAQDRSGRLWFGTVGGGLLSLSDNRFVTQLEPSDNVGTDDVRVIYEDREGTLWLGKRTSGLAKLVRQIVTVHTKADGLSGNNVYPVLEDRGGKLWVGVWGYGLSVSTGPGARFARHPDMPFGFATALHEDRNGRLWVGSNRGGLGFLENDKWQEFTPQRATNELSIFVIRESADGSLWWGTGSGLFRYSKGTKTHYTVRDGLPNDDVKDILEDRLGRLWFATFGGTGTIRRWAFRQPDGGGWTIE